MPPYVIAHRGNSAHFPENTLASFQAALDLGCSLIELDVQITKDGEAIVLHDPTVDRTTNGKGDARQMTLEEVRALSAGYPHDFGDRFTSEKVPTLTDVLELVRGKAKVMIEIKPESVTDSEDKGVEARAIDVVRRCRMEKDVVLISFSRRALIRCHTLAPDILRGHLFYRAEPGEVVRGAQAVSSDLVMPEKDDLNDALVALAREAGLKVATWVVDDPEDLKMLARFDLYGIASNRPADLMQAVRTFDATPG